MMHSTAANGSQKDEMDSFHAVSAKHSVLLSPKKLLASTATKNTNPNIQQEYRP